MKRKILAVILLICMVFLNVGCNNEVDIFEPTEFGEAEGLYMYFGEYRSLTDGTQRERILNEITFEGITFVGNQFIMKNIRYVRSGRLLEI